MGNIAAFVVLLTMAVSACAQSIQDRSEDMSSARQIDTYAVITETMVVDIDRPGVQRLLPNGNADFGGAITNAAYACGSGVVLTPEMMQRSTKLVEDCVYAALDYTGRPLLGWPNTGGFSQAATQRRADILSALGMMAYVANDFYSYLAEELAKKPFRSMEDAKKTINLEKGDYARMRGPEILLEAYRHMYKNSITLNYSGSSQPIEGSIGQFRVAAGPTGVELSRYGITLYDADSGMIAGRKYTFTLSQGTSRRAQESTEKSHEKKEVNRMIQDLMGG